MENSVISPDPGGGTLTPKLAKKYFEFFRPGTEREVILLGDLAAQAVHYVRSKNHKVLCAAAHGCCELCEKAGASDDVSDSHVEYYAASFVRPPRDREFLQRVSVFTAVSGEDLLRMVPEGSLRGHRVHVSRPSTQKFRIRLLAGPPRGLSHVVPLAFDLVPFVRARFGKRQEPDRPPVFLPPFRCESLVSGPSHRPRLLDLSADDCATPEAAAKLHGWVDRLGADIAAEKAAEQQAAAEAIAPAPVAAPPPTAPPPEPVPAPAPAPRPAARPSMTPSAEKAIEAQEAQRRRRVANKPAADLTAAEAVEGNRIEAYLIGDVLPATIPMNGHAKKGGGK